jgi:hypothetical protein
MFSFSALHALQESIEHMMEQAPVDASSAQREPIPAREQDHALLVGKVRNPQKTKQGVLGVQKANMRQQVLQQDVSFANQENIVRQ